MGYSLLRSDTGPWQIFYTGTDSAPVLGALEQDAILPSRLGLWFLSAFAPRFFKDNDTTIEDASARSEEGQETIRISFRHRVPEDEKPGIFRGWVEFRPAQSWLISKYVVYAKDFPNDQVGGKAVAGHRSFRDTGETPRYVMNFDSMEFGNGKGVMNGSTLMTEYTKFELREVPAAEFDMANFGVHTSLASSLSTFWRAVLYAANGIVFLAVAVWLYRRYQNARQAAAA
ncbi:MAG TPA: hypothetical protein VFE24_12980 [Pirellulales bacterium]|nr:hypothetical protein [Pirellulales bacterium]